MKYLIIILITLSSVELRATPPGKRGFNYSAHYKKMKRVKIKNKLFNLNNCNGKTFTN